MTRPDYPFDLNIDQSPPNEPEDPIFGDLPTPPHLVELLEASEWVEEKSRSQERWRLADPYLADGALADDVTSALAASDWVNQTAEDPEFRAMLRHRAVFETLVGAEPEEVSADQMAEAWRIAGEDRYGTKLTRQELQSMLGAARNY